MKWLFLTLLLSGCYVTRLALHQNDLFNTRRPLDEVIGDPQTPTTLRTRLETARRIIAFASQQGLKTEGAYRYVIDTKRSVVTYMVQASAPDRFQSRTWWFPVVGRVPYLGFFEERERDQEAADLKAEGLDVHLGAASAFSSLGWFDDPLFSSMVARSEPELAHLLLHELTHRTYWSPGSVQFNENLAEFVGIELAKRYLRSIGADKEIEKFEIKQGDRILFKHWLEALKGELEHLYASPQRPALATLLTAKAAIVAKYQQPPLRPKFALVDYIKDEEWNNATILANSLYLPDTAAFANAHRCFGKVRMIEFLDELQRLTDKLGEPFAALNAMCSKD